MARTYLARRRSHRSPRTRERIVAAVRELLAEGVFHESTVEQVAERAGIARATLYQHFESRLGLVDAICATFDQNPALVAVRGSVELPDAETALAQTIANSVRFWASEQEVLSQLYGVVAVDSAARDLVERQLGDRRQEFEKLARHLRRNGRLRAGLSHRRVLSLLLVLTSFETTRELFREGLSEAETINLLQETGRDALIA